jgi:hypothetical protein
LFARIWKLRFFPSTPSVCVRRRTKFPSLRLRIMYKPCHLSPLRITSLNI